MSVTAYERPSTSKLLGHGIAGGVIAGIVFAMAEMIINLFLGLPFFGPLRMISSIVLGTQATQPSYPLLNAAIVGVLVHVVLAAIFGIIFIYLLAAVGQLASPAGPLLLYGTIFGFLLWLINFQVIAPFAFPQFTQVNQFWNGFVAHTFFYGTVLGAYIAAINRRLMEEG